jgi:hypothetical protein
VAIIKRKWLTSYDYVPTHAPGDHLIMSWDIAFSEQEKGDYSADVYGNAAQPTKAA